MTSLAACNGIQSALTKNSIKKLSANIQGHFKILFNEFDVLNYEKVPCKVGIGNKKRIF